VFGIVHYLSLKVTAVANRVYIVPILFEGRSFRVCVLTGPCCDTVAVGNTGFLCSVSGIQNRDGFSDVCARECL
jgi:hypothetical protein